MSASRLRIGAQYRERRCGSKGCVGSYGWPYQPPPPPPPPPPPENPPPPPEPELGGAEAVATDWVNAELIELNACDPERQRPEYQRGR